MPKNTNSRIQSGFHEWKFPVIIIILLGSLVFSKWLLTVSQLLLFIFIIFDAGGLKRLAKTFTYPPVLILIAVFFLHIAGLLWTENMDYAMKDIQIKLPLLVFPILFAAIPRDTAKKSILFIKFFIIFVALMSTINLIRYYILPQNHDSQIALWHSHIRFSLLICLSIFMTIWMMAKKILKQKETLIAISILILLITFLIILNSFTGLIIFLFLLVFMAISFRKQVKSKILKILVAIIITVLIGGSFYAFYSVKKKFFAPVEIPSFADLDKHTPSGNDYLHDTSSTLAENGNLIYLYICYEEMIDSWNKRSNYKISQDSAWSSQSNILLRYMTSLGLRKDSSGIMQLSENDIQNIENGIANKKLTNLDPLRLRLYKFFWEMSVYQNCNDPSGHSLTQRMEYWKTGTKIIKEHFWIGVGTGDVQQAFNEMYDEMNSLLDAPYRLRAHNQFLTIMISFGIFGLIIFLWSLIFPFLNKKHRGNLLYIGFIFIFLLSMLNEDTLETQVGVTFYALFNSLFLFVFDQSKKELDSHEKGKNSN